MAATATRATGHNCETRRVGVTPGHYNGQLSSHPLGVRMDSRCTVQGLAKGDVITAINGVDVHFPAEVRARIDSTEPSISGVRNVDVDFVPSVAVEVLQASRRADRILPRKRSVLWWLGITHDAVTAVASASDVVFDLLVLREYHAAGRHGFFAGSLCFMVLAQLTYAYAFANYESFKTSHDTFRTRVCKFLAVLPIAQLVPILWYIESLHLPCVERLLLRCGFAEQSRRRSNEDDARIDREVIDAVGSEGGGLSVPMALIAKARAHGGFVIEAIVEAIPQCALQTVAALTAASVTNTASISILLSVVVIASKSWTVALSRHVPTMAFKAACVVADVTSAFAAIFWVFSFGFEPLHTTLRGWYVLLTLAGVGSSIAFLLVFLGAVVLDNIATNRAWAQQKRLGLLSDPTTGVELTRAESVAATHVLAVSFVCALPVIVALFAIRLALLLLELSVREGNEFQPEHFYAAMQRYLAGHWVGLRELETVDGTRRRAVTSEETTALRTHAACRYLRHLREGLIWFAECRRRDQLERVGPDVRASYLAFATKVGFGPGRCKADTSRGRATVREVAGRDAANAALAAAATLRGLEPRAAPVELPVETAARTVAAALEGANAQLYAAGIILELPEGIAPPGRTSAEGFLVASFQRQSVPHAWLHGCAPRLLALTRSSFVSPITGRVPRHPLPRQRIDACLTLVGAMLILATGPLLHIAVFLLGVAIMASLAFPVVAPIVALTANSTAAAVAAAAAAGGDAPPPPPPLAYLLSATYCMCVLVLIPLWWGVCRGPSFSREVAMKHALHTEVSRFQAQTLLTPQLVGILGYRADEAVRSAMGARAPLAPLLKPPEGGSASALLAKDLAANARAAADGEEVDAAAALRFDVTCSMCLGRISTGSRLFLDAAFVGTGGVPHLPLEVRQSIWAACIDAGDDGARSGEAAGGDVVRRLSCGHRFHERCFAIWEEGKRQHKVHALLSSVETPRGHMAGPSHANDFLCHVCYRRNCFNPRCRDQCPNCCACGYIDGETGEVRFFGSFAGTRNTTAAVHHSRLATLHETGTATGPPSASDPPV